jgi:hypothetical protein
MDNPEFRKSACLHAEMVDQQPLPGLQTRNTAISLWKECRKGQIFYLQLTIVNASNSIARVRSQQIALLLTLYMDVH